MTFAVMLLVAALSASAQETPSKSTAAPVAKSTVAPSSASPVASAPATSGARASPSTRSAPAPKRSLAPRPPGATPPALAADPAAAAAAEAARPPPSGDGSPGSEPLVLPNVTVTETTPVVPKSADVLDAKARLEQALKANPGLRIGGPLLAKLNHAVALAMQQEAKEAAARAAMIEHVENLPAMDEERAKEEVRLMREATARPNNDWRGGRR